MYVLTQESLDVLSQLHVHIVKAGEMEINKVIIRNRKMSIIAVAYDEKKGELVVFIDDGVENAPEDAKRTKVHPKATSVAFEEKDWLNYV